MGRDNFGRWSKGFSGNTGNSLSKAMSIINNKKTCGKSNDPKNIVEVLTSTVDRIDKVFHSESPITGISSGLTEFDKLTTGLQASDLIIVAGRPSMGKTTFAMNIAEHAMMKIEGTVLIFTMEMPAESLAIRLLSSVGNIDNQRIRTGQLDDEDWPRLTSAFSIVAFHDLLIDDSVALNHLEVREKACSMAREYGNLSLIVIDYLQLMRATADSSNRNAEVSEICRDLKALARELNVPIILLSQLNRNLEQRPDKRPIMADLMDSGAIEQDADLIIFIYRDEVYNQNSLDKGTAEIIIGKQRNGPTGTVRVRFNAEYCRFEDIYPLTKE